MFAPQQIEKEEWKPQCQLLTSLPCLFACITEGFIENVHFIDDCVSQIGHFFHQTLTQEKNSIEKEVLSLLGCIGDLSPNMNTFRCITATSFFTIFIKIKIRIIMLYLSYVPLLLFPVLFKFSWPWWWWNSTFKTELIHLKCFHISLIHWEI